MEWEVRMDVLFWGLHDGSYSVSNIQDYFEYILKKHGKKTVNFLIRIYINKIENQGRILSRTFNAWN